MLGVDEFKSMDQLNQCYERAQKHIQQFPTFFKASVGLTIYIWLTMLLIWPHFKTLGDIMMLGWMIGMPVLYSLHGTWRYIGKMMTKPLRMDFGLLIILKFVVFVLCAQCCLMITYFFEFVPVLYERYLDGKTVENAEKIASCYREQNTAQNNAEFDVQPETNFGVQNQTLYLS